MKITFTLTQVDKGTSHDIQVSNTQKIKDTLEVLKDNLPMFADIPTEVHIKEADSGREIGIEDTYEQARVYSGAELLIKS